MQWCYFPVSGKITRGYVELSPRHKLLKTTASEGHQRGVIASVTGVAPAALGKHFEVLRDVSCIGICSEGGDICCLSCNWEMFSSTVGNNNTVNQTSYYHDALKLD